MTEWRKGGGTDLISKCCSLWECWCCPPLKFTPSSPFSSSLSSTCCPWRPTSPRWVDPYTQAAKDTVLGSMVSVGSKNDCFPLFSTPLTTKRKASRTCLRGLGIGFQQRVWRWVKNPLRSVVSLETCIRARTGNCSYKTLIFFFFNAKMSKHMGICCKCLFVLFILLEFVEFFQAMKSSRSSCKPWLSVSQQHVSVKALLKMCWGG